MIINILVIMINVKAGQSQHAFYILEGTLYCPDNLQMMLFTDSHGEPLV